MSITAYIRGAFASVVTLLHGDFLPSSNRLLRAEPQSTLTCTRGAEAFGGPGWAW